MADNDTKEADEAEGTGDEGGSAKADKPEAAPASASTTDDEPDKDEAKPDKKPAASDKPDKASDNDKPKADKPKADKPKADKPKADRASDKKPAASDKKSDKDKPKSDKDKPKSDKDKGASTSKKGDDKGATATAAGYQPPKAVHIGGESLLDRILPHLKKIIIVAIGVGVVATIVYGYRWWNNRKQEAETERINAVFDVARKPVLPRIPGAPEPKIESYATEKDRAAAVLDEMAKRDTEGGSSIVRGGFLLDAGKVDEAIAEYRKSEAAAGIDGVLAKEGLGIALETKAAAEKDAAARNKGFEDALAVFARMQPDEHGPRRAYALYHQARMKILLGKQAEAKDLLTKAREASAGTDLGELIEHRLASIGAS